MVQLGRRYGGFGRLSGATVRFGRGFVTSGRLSGTVVQLGRPGARERAADPFPKVSGPLDKSG
jgi:hypothetical protein